MLNLFQKFRRTSGVQGREFREKFAEYFFGQEDHSWITQNTNTRAVFENLFGRLPIALLTHLVQGPLAFVTSQDYQKYGAARYHSRNTIVVFPEYQRLLAQGDFAAVAFLAHELAMVLYELENVEDKDPLMAEVEADKFVCDVGLADELEALLLAMDESTEKRLRLTYLTVKVFGMN